VVPYADAYFPLPEELKALLSTEHFANPQIVNNNKIARVQVWNETNERVHGIKVFFHSPDT
jgi:hypothetical protein